MLFSDFFYLLSIRFDPILPQLAAPVIQIAATGDNAAHAAACEGIDDLPPRCREPSINQITKNGIEFAGSVLVRSNCFAEAKTVLAERRKYPKPFPVILFCLPISRHRIENRKRRFAKFFFQNSSHSIPQGFLD